jgi:hypothetical protein
MDAPFGVRNPRRTWISLFVVLVIAGSGYAGRANSEEQPAPAAQAAPPDLSGSWDGTWRSHVSPHNGRLRAQLTRVDAYHYRAEFRATFFKVMCYKYTVVLNARPEGDHWILQGQKDLGRLAGGVYHYTAYANACRFNANYNSCKDHGVFAMTRCTVCTPCCK